jgi:ATP-dependent exoDNAse (exonuclease V) beta subunit
MLADVPLETPGLDALSRLAQTHGRVLGAVASEVSAATQVVREVIAHPLLVAAGRAAREGRCYRETPVTLRADDGRVIEGFVDLAFEDEAGFCVVDFKTDRELDSGLERYQRQVQIYAAAVAAASGRPARAVLMRV